ncbi:MAG: HU family DNA-binding protein [Candidatus Hydrogenedentes bacterium]|nr:HU family DNA-binding protein [Candidatus Hydrogenedentota bacterium]
MNKAELVDAISNNAKLTKADAGRALDATLGAMTDILANEARKKGDKISLVGFGSFSVSERIPSDSDTCTPVADVEFEPANAFVKLINPIAMDKGLRFRVQSVGDGADGPVITGELQEGTVRVGDFLLLNNNPSSVGVITGGVIAGIVVAGVLVNEADAGPEISLLLRGIEKKDIRRGMVIVKPGTHREPGPPLSPCFAYFLDGQVTAIAAQSAGLRVDVVLTRISHHN